MNFPEFSDRGSVFLDFEMFDIPIFINGNQLSQKLSLHRDLCRKKNSDYEELRHKPQNFNDPQYKLPAIILPWNEELIKDDTLVLKDMLEYLSMVIIHLEIIKIRRRRNKLVHKCDSLHDKYVTNLPHFDFLMPYKKLARQLCEFVDSD